MLTDYVDLQAKTAVTRNILFNSTKNKEIPIINYCFELQTGLVLGGYI